MIIRSCCKLFDRLLNDGLTVPKTIARSLGLPCRKKHFRNGSGALHACLRRPFPSAVGGGGSYSFSYSDLAHAGRACSLEQ